jgi:hypothetical protein
MSSAESAPRHVDQSEWCLGTFLQHVNREPQPVPPDGCILADKSILCAYPVPNLGPVLDPQMWTFRRSSRRFAPFIAAQLYIYVFLKELCLVFHFWAYAAKRGAPVRGASHADQLAAFIADALAKADIQHAVPDQNWTDLISRMSIAMLTKFSTDALASSTNIEFLRQTLRALWDLRYHLATSSSATFPISNDATDRPKTGLSLLNNPDGLLPHEFGLTGVTWGHGQLLFDHLLFQRRYILFLVL